MLVSDITDALERFAPLAWQEDYDNAGLVVGRMDAGVRGVLLAVDVTDAVLDEAERTGCDLVVTHHPIVFRPLRRLNEEGIVERCVARAIRSGIALYACHTNLDSAPDGMSWRLAARLGVERLRVLQPAGTAACGPLVSDTDGRQVGLGVVGDLPASEDAFGFMRRMLACLDGRVVRHSPVARPLVRRIAVCTGAGASLIGAAAAAGADLYVTSDLRYHDFYAPDAALTVADVGHFESEYCAIDLMYDILSKKFTTFAVRKSEHACNPVNYLIRD